MTPSCHLCSQIDGDAAADLLHELIGDGAYRRRVVDLSEALVAMPSVGALVPGHLLLCPRSHVRSFASMPDMRSAQTALSHAVGGLCSWARRPVQYFEHGNSRDGDAIACTVEHAHIHLLPGVPNLQPLVASAVRWRPVVGGLEALSDVVGDREYLMLGGLDGRVWAAPQDLNNPIPSQWMRRVAARALGVPDRWNWREHPRPTMVRESLGAARSLRPVSSTLTAHA